MLVNRTLLGRPVVASALASLALFGAACESTETASVDAVEEDLTSNTALARTLTFAGAVYVDATASDYTILDAMKKQTQTAFGALREANIGVNSRELKDIDIKTWKKVPVTMFDTAANDTVGAKKLRVEYTFTDTAVVPKAMSTKSSLGLGVLAGNYAAQKERVFKECTSGDQHAQEFMNGALWYVFNPSLSKCRTAMTAEQKLIDADRKKVPLAQGGMVHVPKSEVNRLYLPVTMKLSGNKTNKGTSWPEYDRLWLGGVQKNKLVIAMVSGMMSDWAAGEKKDTIDDSGYRMWFEGIREVIKLRPGLKYVRNDNGADLSSFTVGTTKVSGVTFDQIMDWELNNYSAKWPVGISTYDQKRALRMEAGKKLAKNWIVFEAPVKVKVGSAAEVAVTVVLNSYFGAEGDATPHKKAIKNSDVFIYNGHSYIGYGPLDPKNFSSSDFPSSYQIMFVNSCVSYNYYEKDYWALKSGGSANLEIVTNGLESWVAGSGGAMGRFVGQLISGSQPSYSQLLKAAEFTANDYGYDWGMDALRVVDGELDNKYTPTKTKIVVK
jgi:hypothetical protein